MNLISNVYGPVYRKIIFPFWEKVVRRRNTYHYYQEISGNPWLPSDQIAALRLSKLKALLEYCENNVPFYADLFHQHGLEVARVGGIDDVRHSGIVTSKEIVQAAGGQILSRQFVKDTLLNSGTSGSTGVSVRFYMTIDNWSRRWARKLRSEDWMGKPLGTPTTVIWGHHVGYKWPKRAKDFLYWRFQNYQFLSAYDIGENSLERAVERIGSFGAKFIESYVTPVHLMAQVIEKRGLRPPRLEGIVVGAERLYPFQKEKIEKAFGCPVYNRYGATEFSNIASECKERCGMHINEDDMWVEVVDEDGQPVFDEPGDLVITDLTNYAMPLIRYRIADAAIMSSKRCKCGRTFGMLEDIVGRESEVLRTKDGRAIHDQYFLWELTMVPELRKFQIVQKTLSLIVVKVESDPAISREVTEGKVRKALAELEGYGITVEIEFVDEIPLTAAGKHRSFISELKV